MRPGNAALILSMAACSRTLPHPAYTPQPASALIEVSAPPPPGRIERVPAPPWASAVWVDGEWAWRRDRWAWRPGSWVEPPPGAKYAPWVFERGPDGRLWMAPGTWHDAKGAALPAPVPLMSADVEATQVVNATGAVELVGRTLRPGAAATPGASASSTVASSTPSPSSAPTPSSAPAPSAPPTPSSAPLTPPVEPSDASTSPP